MPKKQMFQIKKAKNIGDKMKQAQMQNPNKQKTVFFLQVEGAYFGKHLKNKKTIKTRHNKPHKPIKYHSKPLKTMTDFEQFWKP
jgi:hypothetical protein